MIRKRNWQVELARQGRAGKQVSLKSCLKEAGMEEKGRQTGKGREESLEGGRSNAGKIRKERSWKELGRQGEGGWPWKRRWKKQGKEKDSWW